MSFNILEILGEVLDRCPQWYEVANLVDFIADPDTELTLRDISLTIVPYEVNRMDSTYIKFKEKEAKQKR